LTSILEFGKLFSARHHRQICGQFIAKRRVVMTDNVMLFPHVLEPTVALKTYAPVGVKFWEGQQAALDGIKEYCDGWFTRRQSAAQAAGEASKRIGASATPADMQREYQDWLKGAMERMVAEGEAIQLHMAKVGSQLSAQFSSTTEAVKAAAEAQQSEARRTG
jgi:hypothetical protein